MKRANPIAAAIICVMALAAKCEDSEPSKTAPAPTAADPKGSVVSPREQLLAELSSRLDQVQTAKPGQHLKTGGGIDVSPLVGMTRGELRAALGAPSACDEGQITDADGRQVPVAPCQKSSDWFYSFYHLPEGWVGGGPELLLGFDDKGICSSAGWMFTQ
jgi:hypothetical protein